MSIFQRDKAATLRLNNVFLVFVVGEVDLKVREVDEFGLEVYVFFGDERGRETVVRVENMLDSL
jgi:hypothetical protein